jgi:hypothetical protein
METVDVLAAAAAIWTSLAASSSSSVATVIFPSVAIPLATADP